MRSKSNLLRGSILIVIAVLAGCATNPPPPPHALKDAAIELDSQPRVDALNCKIGNCIHWYRVSIPRTGSLRLTLETFEAPAQEGSQSFFGGNKQPDPTKRFELGLTDGSGVPLGSTDGRGFEQRAFDARVTRGSYLVSVRADEAGGFGYRLTNRFQGARRPPPPPPPKPKPPQFQKRPGSILEFEGYGTDVEAVLIDLGSDHGVSQGMTGHLIDGGEIIGKIVLGQVYPEGSRCRVQGGLTRPLGTETTVEVLIPVP